MSILTYKVKVENDFSVELAKAKQIAEFALKTKSLSSKDVKHFGLNSVISNQILRKYSKNKKLKRVNSVKLVIPSQGINYKNNIVSIPSLKVKFSFDKVIRKINQIEVDNEWYYVSCEVVDENLYIPMDYVGVDRNATGHIAVCALDKKLSSLANRLFILMRNIKT